SDVLKQGETVIAIGNPLGLDFYGSVTTGVISGKDRAVPVDLNADGYEDWETEVLQTDAAINPGNSGGALI
ncbi:2-alkenal reductase, partial [Butyricicoccus sp. 1XD8-22]